MIRFFTHEIEFRLLDQKHLKSWIIDQCAAAGKRANELSYVFCSDEYLLVINKEHLQHDYYTDIITFNYCLDDNDVSGELYLSIERIRENATKNRVSFADELHRVMIHGVLHLLGEDDKADAEAVQMRKSENEALAARLFHVKHYATPKP